MLNETQARHIAGQLNGTFVRPEKVDKATQHVISEASGKRQTKIASHTTNGVKRYQVHVTFPDKFSEAYTIGSMTDEQAPLA